MSTSLTIENIELQLITQIQQQAKQKGMDMNSLLITAIKQYLINTTPPVTPATYHDLDNLAGSWTEKEYQTFTKNTQAFNQIDDELWQ